MTYVPSYLAHITFVHFGKYYEVYEGSWTSGPRIAETNRYMKSICGLCNIMPSATRQFLSVLCILYWT